MDKWNRQEGFCCDTCMHYAPKNNHMGRCRRHAPSMEGFPVVYADHDWCGDHKVGSNPHRITELTIDSSMASKIKGELKICEDVPCRG